MLGFGCHLQNCHNVDVKCGWSPTQGCTSIKDYGDWCRDYASCEVVKGKCRLVTSANFEKCQPCIKKCEEDFKGDRPKLFECAYKCKSVI